MIDTVKLKRYTILGIKILIVLEIIAAVTEGVSGQKWGRLGFDLVIAGVIYLSWGRLKGRVEQKRTEVKARVEHSGEDLRLWDALAFSLLWSEEIYAAIPADRKRLVVIAVTLIVLGILIGSVQIVGAGLMHLVVSAALVLAAVNLLVWVVSTERGAKESLQTELDLARDVQSSLMPTSDPEVPGFDIAGKSAPASEVGGDHFAYHGTGEGTTKFSISVFDVSGKGMQAAMSAVFVNGALASEFGSSTSPAEILTSLNRSFYAHSRRGNFVSFLLASVDLSKRSVTFANAGQVKPLLWSGGEAGWLDGSGVNFPLGMVEDARYRNKTVKLSSGDLLLLMTDGITEAMNADHQEFGEDRLLKLVANGRTPALSSPAIVDAVSSEVRKHMGKFPQHDDMTLVVLKAV